MTVRPFLIANHWVQGGGEPFSSLNPANGQEVARIASASAADVDSAVGAARAALGRCDWASLKHHERARFLTRISDLITGRADQLARLQSSENGKTLRECRAQVASAAATFRYYAAVCETFESEITTQRGPSMTMTVYEPVGVVAAITPWNSPADVGSAKARADPLPPAIPWCSSRPK
jgi:acyl-CoA reductase-like NAD-dependent aldehyde dehydrogenase